MRKLLGGTRVRKGYYLHQARLALAPVARDGEPLPGGAGDLYLHLPWPAVALLGPLLGAALLVFLPFIGFYLVARSALRPVAGLLRRTSAELLAVVSASWRPGEAHLTGRRVKAGASAEGPAADELSSLEAEIARRRAAR